MAYQALYRRYRSQRFDQIVGQEHVVQALRNAAAEDRTSHAYLFSGPRGTGKTSTARILAKVLNCPEAADGEPCGVCDSCLSIERGSSLDVTELDAASNRGINEIRDLISTTALASPGRWKVYILDEVHMLTADASAALLKTLEEPPDHVVFVLATTDPEKVLPTIRSRTQHLRFTLLPTGALEEHVRWVVADAELEVTDEDIAVAMRDGGGSARDTLSALDRIVAAGGSDQGADVAAALTDALMEQDGAAALLAVADAAEQGRDPRTLGEALLVELRNAFLVAMNAADDRLTETALARSEAVAEAMRPPGITRALELLGAAMVDMRQAADPRIPLEVALIQICRADADQSPAALLERIERLERQLREGGSTAPATSTAEVSPSPSGPAADSGPVAEAREALARIQAADGSGAKPALGAVRAAQGTAPAPTPEPPEQPAPPSPSPPPEPLAPQAGDPQPTPASAADAGASGLPTRDELTLAWGDDVLSGLRPKLKALFAAGRFTEVADDVAVFALPNEAHCARCQDHRGDVEAELQRHFGRPVPLRLVADDGAPTAPDAAAPAGEAAAPPTAATTPAPAPPEVEDEDVGDVRELEDAPDAGRSGLDSITEVFGAVEAVESEEST